VNGTETRSIEDFIAERHITMSAERVSSNPNMDDDQWAEDASHWRITFRINAASFETYFSQGSAHTEAPTAADVLDCLASDASTVTDLDFEEWAGELGYNPDSIKDLHTYNVIKAQSDALKLFLGDTGYRELIEDVERL
jgi:hypothetical protein